MQEKLEAANTLSMRQWGLIETAGTQLTQAIFNNTKLKEENKKLATHAGDLEGKQKESTARYAELYQRYMQTRKEKAALEKQVFACLYMYVFIEQFLLFHFDQ